MKIPNIDILHLAHAKAYGADYLVTKDEQHLLSNANWIEVAYRVSVVEPRVLVPIIYDAIWEVRGRRLPDHEWPPCVQNALQRLPKRKKLFSERLLLANFIRACVGDNEKVHDVLRRAPNYKRELTERMLISYPPCAIPCEFIKKNMEPLCPLPNGELCELARPPTEDVRKERQERRVAKTFPSPMYFYANVVKGL